MKQAAWIAHHRDLGHHPEHAPTLENPDLVRCDCGGIWRILTPEQIRKKFAHLGWRDTPARRKSRQQLQTRIAEIWTEQEVRNQAIREAKDSGIPPLRVTDRYAERARWRR